MWIFGYGSLVWKADFPYVKKIVGFVKGYERKFWQASIDHRGVPEKPGRVVTLVPAKDPDAKVWGIAYEIIDVPSIQALNSREKRYQQIDLSFHPIRHCCHLESRKLGNGNDSMGDGQNVVDVKDFDPFIVVVYIGPEEGPLYLGDASIPDIATQIANAEGPSGPNRDYVFKLAEFMRSEVPSVQDLHLFALEKELLGITCPGGV